MSKTSWPAAPGSFRERVSGGALCAGTFVKTPTGHATEILGDLGYDFVVADAEHAPLDRTALDNIMQAAGRDRVPVLVRVPSGNSWHLLSVLDCGAAGVVVPHVMNAKQAEEIALSCRYRGGRRGFSAGTRAGRFGGEARWDLVDRADAETLVIAQIEDPEAVDNVEEIAAVDGVDALFIGRGDLTVAYGAPSNDADVIEEASRRIADAAKKHGKAVAVFAASIAEVEKLRKIGASIIVYSADQSFLRAGARKALEDIQALDGA